MNPQHPGNGGKADGWRALGYQVDDPGARQEDAADLRNLISGHLLWNGKVEESRETAHGRHYKVLNGFIGPNGRHATFGNLLAGGRARRQRASAARYHLGSATPGQGA